jgi:DHA1 family bicyclomycin/chloramphenicol resistance-like MFS transporter
MPVTPAVTVGDDVQAGRSQGPVTGDVPAIVAAPADTGQPGTWRTVLTLGAFVAVGPLTIDMYLPALPTIAADLQTTAAAVQLTLTGTLIGLALGQLALGPISDAIGRRAPLLAGTALHILASLLILVAPNIATLGVLRVLQGVGTAAGAVVALAIVRDLFDGRAAAVVLSRLFLVMGAAPVLAPTIGGEVLRFTSWRGVFAVLAAYGALLLVMGWAALPETLPAHRRSTSGVRTALRTYRSLLADRTYVGLIVVAGLTMSALFSYIAGSSFVYQRQFGLDEQQFGLLFGAGAFWLIAATQLNPLLLRRWSPERILTAATIGGAAGSVLLLVLAGTGVGGLWGAALPVWAVLFAGGLALPNAPALALSRHGSTAGAAAALLGAFQFGVGAAVSPAVGLLGGSATAMGAVMLAALLLAVTVLAVVVRPRAVAVDATEPDATMPLAA